MNYSFESSKAFIDVFNLAPTQAGPLQGLAFAVKDLIDIKGHITGGGNPGWKESHSKAPNHAICVEQLLQSGARCVGKTITDELAFSLIGENYFYGTPVNPKALDRVAGGSSSGSAAAVACGLVDFALGTDTGGSVRVPASNCGIWGYRPSHGRISLAGVMPFAPSFDTVGILAKNAKVLARAAGALLGVEGSILHKTFTIAFLDDIFADVYPHHFAPIKQSIEAHYPTASETLATVGLAKMDLHCLFETYSNLQCSEVWNSLGEWIERYKPPFSPVSKINFHQLAKNANRSCIQSNIMRREHFNSVLNRQTQNNLILCFPTSAQIAPLRNTIGTNPKDPNTNVYYPKVLGINAIAGLSRSPQVSIPCCEVDGIPIGLSLLGHPGHDESLLELAKEIEVLLKLWPQ